MAFGNGLVGPDVVDAIAKGFLAEPDADLEHRLLMGIEAGRDAGGQGTREHKAERSAALRVYSRDPFPDIDLRVDLHATRSRSCGGLDRVQAVRSLLSATRRTSDRSGWQEDS